MTNEIGIYDANTDELLLRCSDWTEAGRVLCDRGGPWRVVAAENRHGDPVYRLMSGPDCIDHEDAICSSTVEEAEQNVEQKAGAELEMLSRVAMFSNTLENGFCGAYARVIKSAEVAA